MRYVIIVLLAVTGFQSHAAFAQTDGRTDKSVGETSNQQTGSGGGLTYSDVTAQQQDLATGNYGDAYQQVEELGGYGDSVQKPRLNSGLYGRQGFIASGEDARSASVHFSRFKKVDDKKKNSMREDSAVMNHMISRGLPLQNSRSALGVNYAQSYGKNDITYNDHGLTFVYHVPFQLFPEGKTVNDTADEEKIQTPWDKAKDELQRPLVAGRTNVNTAINGARQKFNPEYVDRITEQVRIALGSAGNIRDLSKGDMVTVFVYGASSNPGMRSVMAWRVDWNQVKESGPGLSSAVEETSYEEKSGAGIYAGYSEYPSR